MDYTRDDTVLACNFATFLVHMHVSVCVCVCVCMGYFYYEYNIMVIPFYIVSIKIVIITHGMNERGEGEERVLIRRGYQFFCLFFVQ